MDFKGRKFLIKPTDFEGQEVRGFYGGPKNPLEFDINTCPNFFSVLLFSNLIFLPT